MMRKPVLQLSCVLVCSLCSVQLALGRPFAAVFDQQHTRGIRQQTNTDATGSLIAHICLWNNGTASGANAASSAAASASSGSTAQESASASAAAMATATASATATATATASATATLSSDATAADATATAADATATAASSASTGIPAARARAQCSLNPSYFFSLPAPVLDGEKLLLELTAMKYGCLNHTSFASCAVDQANWCTWHEDRSRCEMSYDDADFVHLLLWSRTRIACSQSKLEQLVTCSYITVDCTGQCAWAQGACYPTWYASMVEKPQSIQFFKRQVFTGDPEVWGSCAGADLYRTYSNICNHGQDQCTQDPQCQWVSDFETQAMPNPLNFTKPCLLSTTKFAIESVFLSFNSEFSTAVITAQSDCIRSRREDSCTKRTVDLAADVLEGAFSYNSSLAPATGTAPGPPPSGSFQASESDWARTENLAALPGQEHADEGFSAAESELPALRIDPSKLGQAGTAADGQPNWFIQPCASPEACSSAFTALGRLHVVIKPGLGHDVLTQPLAAPPA